MHHYISQQQDHLIMCIQRISACTFCGSSTSKLNICDLWENGKVAEKIAIAKKECVKEQIYLFTYHSVCMEKMKEHEESYEKVLHIMHLGMKRIQEHTARKCEQKVISNPEGRLVWKPEEFKGELSVLPLQYYT